MDYSDSAASWFEKTMDFFIGAANGKKMRYYAAVCGDRIYPELRVLRLVASGMSTAELCISAEDENAMKLCQTEMGIEAHFFIGDGTADEAGIMRRIKRLAEEKYSGESIEAAVPKRTGMLGRLLDLLEGKC